MSKLIRVYHGGHRLNGDLTIVPLRRGHAEHGPGVYGTTSWETANRYAKGGGAVYAISMKRPRWLEGSDLDLRDAQAFVSNVPRLPRRRQVLDRITHLARGNKLPAAYLVNVMVNLDIAGKPGVLTAAYLASRGVDASLVHQSMDDWIVLFNPDIVVQIEKLTPGDVGTRKFPFDLPRIHR